jgi:hypothetical protein
MIATTDRMRFLVSLFGAKVVRPSCVQAGRIELVSLP